MRRLLYLALAFSLVALSVSCTKGGSSLYPVQSGERWGYIDKSGTFVVNPQFDQAYPFLDGLARVVNDGQTGYITPDGQYAILPQYKDGTDFVEGKAFVVTENSYPICIDRGGKELFTLKGAEVASCFSEGLAAFCNNQKQYGYVDAKGIVVIAPQFDWADDFHEGLAAVSKGERYGYIAPTGAVAIAYQFDKADCFSEGLAAVSNGKSYGFIDKKGAYVINPQFEVVGSFSEGLAPFYNGNMWGYVDKSGKYAINPQFGDAREFHDGLAVAGTAELLGFIDKKGRMVINPQFEGAYYFLDGVASVCSGDQWGFVNKKGVFVVNPQFERLVGIREPCNSRVRSSYYDVSEFVAAMLEGESSLGAQLIALCHEGATLKEVAEHKRFGSAKVESSTKLRYEDESSSIGGEDIFLNTVDFYFQSPVYEDYYDYYYYESNRNYQWTAKLASAVVQFGVGGKAEGKSVAIAAALFEKAKSKLGLSDETRFGFDDVTGFYGYNNDRKVGLVVFASGEPGLWVSGSEQVAFTLVPVDRKTFEQWCAMLEETGNTDFDIIADGEETVDSLEWSE